MTYLPFAIIGAAATAGLNIDFQKWKTAEEAGGTINNYCMETVGFEKNPATNGREQVWTLGVVVRAADHDDLIADATGYCDLLTAFLNSLTRTQLGDRWHIVNVDIDEPTPTWDEAYFYYIYDVTVRVADKARA